MAYVVLKPAGIRDGDVWGTCAHCEAPTRFCCDVCSPWWAANNQGGGRHVCEACFDRHEDDATHVILAKTDQQPRNLLWPQRGRA